MRDICSIFTRWTRRKYVLTIFNSHLRRYKSTIFALSSGFGKSGVAVFRISGPSCENVIYSMTNFKTMPTPRVAYLKNIRDPETKEPLDKGLLLWFPGPKSFTGEDMCEFQVHGSKAVIQAITAAVSKIPNMRPAEPGEFTKRAFYAGKFNLTEVEGISDLIDAETELQRKQAIYQMEGSLGQMYLNWRKIILENLALVEAFIDFSEDNNIEDDILSSVETSLQNLLALIKVHVNDHRKGEILRDGIKTVIVGSPNVGKSSLLNLLCQRPAAIVTEIAGTTRDVVQTTLNINGYPVLLSDTAGIRKDQFSDLVEKEGIRRSVKEASEANLLLLVLNAQDVFGNSANMSADENLSHLMSSFCTHYQKLLGIDEILSHTRHIIVANKWDLLNYDQQVNVKRNNSSNFIGISCKTQFGIQDLLKLMSQQFQNICAVPDRRNPACSRARHRHHLQECVNYLEKYLNETRTGDPEKTVVFAAECLRTAVWHMGMITGLVATDEVLSVIFKQFCVGK